MFRSDYLSRGLFEACLRACEECGWTLHRRRSPSRVREGRGATLLGFRDTGSCTGHRHCGKTDGELYLYYKISTVIGLGVNSFALAHLFMHALIYQGHFFAEKASLLHLISYLPSSSKKKMENHLVSKQSKFECGIFENLQSSRILLTFYTVPHSETVLYKKRL